MQVCFSTSWYTFFSKDYNYSFNYRFHKIQVCYLYFKQCILNSIVVLFFTTTTWVKKQLATTLLTSHVPHIDFQQKNLQLLQMNLYLLPQVHHCELPCQGDLPTLLRRWRAVLTNLKSSSEVGIISSTFTSPFFYPPSWLRRDQYSAVAGVQDIT